VSAGLPGLGLGGLFFILSALAAPLVELVRTARGRSSLARWRRLGRQFALALAMIVAVDVTLRLAFGLVSLVGGGEPPSIGGLTVLPGVPIAITTGLLATVLATAKGMELATRVRSGGMRPLPGRAPLPSRPGLADLRRWAPSASPVQMREVSPGSQVTSLASAGSGPEGDANLEPTRSGLTVR
jgi:hypothetical protein